MYPFPTVCADRASTDWFSSISRTLKWNERERQKSFVVIEENPAIAKVAKQQAKAEVAAAKDQDQAEEDEVSDEEDDGFDIDVIDDSSSATSLSTDSQELSPSVKAAQEVMLQPGESAIGRQKTKEQAYEQAHQQAHAEAAAHALSEGFPSSGSQSSTNHNQSGIQSPSRFLGPHPSAPPTARHVAFSNTSAPSSASHLHSPRAVKPGDSGRYDDREGLKTPTAAEIRKGNGPTQKVGRSRSAEARHHHPRAFAAWGQDGSESESNASEDEN
jgi:NAD+ kinase